MVRKQLQADEEGFYRVSVRLPHDVHEAVKEMSTKEQRSLNAQIVWCLSQCTDRWKKTRKREDSQ
jgi:hypothetical protein